MEAAEGYEVGGLGFAAMRPVLYVVRVDVVGVRASGEAATSIARVECAAKCWWNAWGLATDVERLALVVLQNDHSAAVASESARGFRGNARPILDFALTC